MKTLKTLIILLFPVLLHAQESVEGGLMIGFANYQGDLAEDPIEFGETKLAYGLFARYHINNKFKLRGNLFRGTISGDDANAIGNQKDRQWKFKTDLVEVSFQGEYHPLEKPRYSTGGAFQKQLSPYVATGLGVTFADNTVTVPEADQGKFPEADLSSVFVSIPFIVGIRADLMERTSFGFEWGWRTVLNDGLDGVSQNGNPDKNDWYLFIGLNLSVHFGGISDASN